MFRMIPQQIYQTFLATFLELVGATRTENKTAERLGARNLPALRISSRFSYPIFGATP